MSGWNPGSRNRKNILTETDAPVEPVISCAGLTKRFRRVLAVDGLDLDVQPGEVFGFLGPNGAGKSTTLRMMVGLIRPSGGRIRVFGHDVWRDRCRALSRVGAMIEAPAFYKYISGRDNLRLLANTGANRSSKEIDAALDMVGLLGRGGDKVKAYSQGMRQRLGIALAIIGSPDLVLLDEPTNGLDPQGMREVRELVKSLARDQGMTVFLSSHLLNEVEQVCTRIAVINKGKVIEAGRVDELLGGAETYKVSVDYPDRAIRELADLKGVVPQPNGDGALTVRMNGTSSAELNKFLVERGIAVSELVACRRSLEELYLRLMDGNDA